MNLQFSMRIILNCPMCLVSRLTNQPGNFKLSTFFLCLVACGSSALTRSLIATSLMSICNVSKRRITSKCMIALSILNSMSLSSSSSSNAANHILISEQRNVPNFDYMWSWVTLLMRSLSMMKSLTLNLHCAMTHDLRKLCAHYIMPVLHLPGTTKFENKFIRVVSESNERFSSSLQCFTCSFWYLVHFSYFFRVSNEAHRFIT